MAKTFVRDGKEVQLSELKKHDVFYYYEGERDAVTEYRLWKVLEVLPDGGLNCQPMPIIVLGDKINAREL